MGRGLALRDEDHFVVDMRLACGESFRGLVVPPKGFKWSSFSHQIQLHLTRIVRVQLEAVNRPVPCKHKGIRQFSEFLGKTQV
jgi:hypothetical protein